MASGLITKVLDIAHPHGTSTTAEKIQCRTTAVTITGRLFCSLDATKLFVFFLGGLVCWPLFCYVTHLGYTRNVWSATVAIRRAIPSQPPMQTRGPVRQPYAGVDFISPARSMNWATFSTLMEDFLKSLIFPRNRMKIMYLLKQNLCSFPLELGEPSICLLINLCPDL
jgi:hypothetical protein